jgi:hypothetical protein
MQKGWSAMAAFMAATFFIFIFSWQWLGGNRYLWLGGNIKGGDLTQHYVAGKVWNEKKATDLYHGFAFSRRLAQWEKTMPVQEKNQTKFDSFNYVYSPLIAKVAALFSNLDYWIWIQAWLVIMLATSAGSLVLLSKTISGLSWKVPRDWFLLLSFPSLWYTYVSSQNSTISLFLASAASLLMTQGHLFSAGAAFSCVFYKPQLVVVVGLIMLISGQFRFLLGLITGTVFWLAVQLLTCGLDLNMGWIGSMAMSWSGQQLRSIGLNQSWRGWFMSIPGVAKPLASSMGLGFSILLIVLAGRVLRKLERLESWRPGYNVLIAIAFCTVVSPHTVYYDFLLVLGLWLICCRLLPNTFAGIVVCFLGWLANLLSDGVAFGLPRITTPLTTLWLALALSVLTIQLKGPIMQPKE